MKAGNQKWFPAFKTIRLALKLQQKIILFGKTGEKMYMEHRVLALLFLGILMLCKPEMLWGTISKRLTRRLGTNPTEKPMAICAWFHNTTKS